MWYHNVCTVTFFLGSVTGLHVIQIRTFTLDVTMTMGSLVLSVIHVYADNCSSVFIQSAYCMIIFNLLTEHDFTSKHLRFMMKSSLLILYTISCALNPCFVVGIRKTSTLIWTIVGQAFALADTDILNTSDMLSFCPALLDILDGLEMTHTQVNPTNPVWAQITICLAILMFYVSSLLEIYYLSFPEQTTGSILTERRVKCIQLVSSVVFLVLRLALFARNPREFALVVKTIIRVFSHYQMWSNLRPAPMQNIS